MTGMILHPDKLICDWCEQLITDDDYEQPHEEGCPNANYYDDDDAIWHDGCLCDLHMCSDCVKEREQAMQEAET